MTVDLGPVATTSPIAPAPREPAPVRRDGWLRWVPARIVSALPIVILAVLVLIPIGYLIYGAFRTDAPGVPGGSFTLENFAFLASPDFWVVARNSILVAGATTAGAFVLGTLLAFVVVRFDPPGARWLDTFLLVPAYVPQFIMAIAWVLLLSPAIGYLNSAAATVGLPPADIYTFGGIIWVSVLTSTPVAYLYAKPALLAFDSSLEESARVFGATPGVAVRRILLPLARPALLSACLVLFVTTLGDFGIVGVIGAQARIDVIATKLLTMVTDFPSDPNAASVLGLSLMTVSLSGLLVTRKLLKNRDYVTVGTRGSKQRPNASRLQRVLGLVIALVFIFVAAVLPIAALVVGSLQAYVSPTFQSPWTFSNYTTLPAYPTLARSIVNSVLYSVGAAVICMLLSVWFARIAVRGRGILARLIDGISNLPLAIPHVVFGLALLWMWIVLPVGVYGSSWILLIAYVGLFLPFGMRAAVAAMQSIDPSLEEAGRMSGATGFRTGVRIVLPLMVPAVLAGGTIILYNGMRELSASLLVYSTGSEVMSIVIWNLYEIGNYVQLFALSVINIVLILVIVAAANHFSRRVGI